VPDVVVVGAGILGTSVAFHAARLGARVTVVDGGLPGCGVTGVSFAWIGASGVPPGPAAVVRRAATDEWRRLAREVPGVAVGWTGSLVWSDAAPPAELGDAQRLVDRDAIAALEPGLREPPPWAVHTRGDGAVDPVAVTGALVDAARRHGADVVVGTPVASVAVRAGRAVGVRLANGDVLAAPTVVLAAGADATTLCAPLGFPPVVTRSPAVLLRLDGADRLPHRVHGVLAGPRVEVRPAGDGRLLAALAYAGETSVADLTRRADDAVVGLASLLHAGDRLRRTGAHVGWRPMPLDGEPVVGPVPGVGGLHLAVTHSGVTLAPVLGRLLAEELASGVRAPDLRGCRPERFVPGPDPGP